MGKGHIVLDSCCYEELSYDFNSRLSIVKTIEIELLLDYEIKDEAS